MGTALWRGIVAPHAGAWIETHSASDPPNVRSVAPHAGAWIETLYCLLPAASRPVAPHAGAWIETADRRCFININFCRAPRGRVD